VKGHAVHSPTFTVFAEPQKRSPGSRGVSRPDPPSGCRWSPREVGRESIERSGLFWLPQLNRRFNSGPPSAMDRGRIRVVWKALPDILLLGRPGDQSFDDFRDQEKHDGAAEVLAHGFHISSLKFYRSNSHKEGRCGDYRRGSSPPHLERYRSWRLRIACRHLNARFWILMDRCCCGWQVNDNSEDFRVVSLFGVVPLEPAPFAQHRTLLVVGKGYSVTGPLGGVFLPGHPGCPHRLRQEWVVFPEGQDVETRRGQTAPAASRIRQQTPILHCRSSG
jgi:hypothetical protein